TPKTRLRTESPARPKSTDSTTTPPRPQRTTPFPYTTLFRSRESRAKPARPERPEPWEFRASWARPEPPAPREPRAKPDSKVKKRSEEHTSELQSPCNLVCRLLLEKKNQTGRS